MQFTCNSWPKRRYLAIRIKTGESYSIIENDVLKLSDEISNQNELVKEYLSDATTSLVISITGLVFALLVSGIQIIQNRRKKKHDDAKHYQLLMAMEEKLIEGASKAINPDS